MDSCKRLRARFELVNGIISATVIPHSWLQRCKTRRAANSYRLTGVGAPHATLLQATRRPSSILAIAAGRKKKKKASRYTHVRRRQRLFTLGARVKRCRATAAVSRGSESFSRLALASRRGLAVLRIPTGLAFRRVCGADFAAIGFGRKGTRKWCRREERHAARISRPICESCWSV